MSSCAVQSVRHINSLRARCLRCRSSSKRRGHVEHEKGVIDHVCRKLQSDLTGGAVAQEQLPYEQFQANFCTELIEETAGGDDSEAIDLYRSRLSRQFVRCGSDDKALKNMLSAMEGKSSDQLWAGDWNVAWYRGENCRGCGVTSIYDPKNESSTEAVSRTVLFLLREKRTSKNKS